MALLFSVGGKLATWARQVLASRTKIFIVLELVTGGELFDRIVSASRFGVRLFARFIRRLIRPCASRSVVCARQSRDSSGYFHHR